MLSRLLAFALLLGLIARPAVAQVPSSETDDEGFQPADLYGLTLGLDSYLGLLPGTTPVATGTVPPAATVAWASPAVDANGYMTKPIGLCFQIDGAGTRGTATFKHSADNCATFIATGVVTAATTALTGANAGITITWPVGAYLTDNLYKGLVQTWTDRAGVSFTNATVSTQPDYVISGTNSKPALQGGRGTGVLLANAGLSLGTTATIFVVATPSTSINRYLFSDSGNFTAFITNFASKNYEWFNNGDRYTLSAAGTGLNILAVTQVNAGALLGYFNGASAFTQTATVTMGSMRKIINDEGANGSPVADVMGYWVWNRVLGTQEMRRVNLYLSSRFGVTLP